MEDLYYWQAKFESCYYSERLIRKLVLLNKKSTYKIDLNQIKKAIYYAKKYHGDQKRDSGAPFYSHPLAVAEMVADYVFKTDTLVTSILHDTLEDTTLTTNILAAIFDANIASQVENLTRIKLDKKISAAEIVERLWVQKKYDLLLIKLFDRIHNLQTIYAKSPENIAKTVEETLKQFISLSLYFRFQDPWLLNIDQIITELCYQLIRIKPLRYNVELTFEDNCQLFFPDM